MKVVLPWPDKRLSPNARLHWRARVGPRQDAKRIAGWSTVQAKGFYALRDALRGSDGKIAMTITFYPPDKRHRDDDNMIAGFKAARDGIADALGVDDRRFRPIYVFGEAEKPGRVEVDFPPNYPPEQTKNDFPESADSAKRNGPDGECALPRPTLDPNAVKERLR